MVYFPQTGVLAELLRGRRCLCVTHFVKKREGDREMGGLRGVRAVEEKERRGRMREGIERQGKERLKQ